MSKKEKLLKKFLEIPTKKDLIFEELETLLLSCGYKKLEGKGSAVKDARSRNFQKIVKEETDKIDTKFQLFIATRSLYEELNHSDYLVGEEFTASNKSLKV